MKLVLVNTEYFYNRADRRKERRDYVVGASGLSDDIVKQIKELAAKYRMNMGELVGLVLAYYFGDGRNHLECEHCGFFSDSCALEQILQPGTVLDEVTTVPILDKGTVVVGLSDDDKGE